MSQLAENFNGCKETSVEYHPTRIGSHIANDANRIRRVRGMSRIEENEHAASISYSIEYLEECAGNSYSGVIPFTDDRNAMFQKISESVKTTEISAGKDLESCLAITVEFHPDVDEVPYSYVKISGVRKEGSILPFLTEAIIEMENLNVFVFSDVGQKPSI